MEEIGRWLHEYAKEAKAERTAELIERLAKKGEVDFSSDEEDDSDVDN